MQTANPHRKRIEYERESRTFAVYVGAECVGYAETYLAGEALANKAVYDRLMLAQREPAADAADAFEDAYAGAWERDETPEPVAPGAEASPAPKPQTPTIVPLAQPRHKAAGIDVWLVRHAALRGWEIWLQGPQQRPRMMSRLFGCGAVCVIDHALQHADALIAAQAVPR